MNPNQEAYELMEELKDLFNVDSYEEALERYRKVLPLAEKMNAVFPRAIKFLEP